MKKIVIIFICLLLLVSCKDKNNSTNGTNKKEEVINVKSNDGNWADVKASLVDSLNNKELIEDYSISIPDWKNERTDDYILFQNSDIVLVMMYKDDYYKTQYVEKYNKDNSKKMTINSYKVDYEDGSVSYFGQHYKYVSYYINEDITIKLIGMSKEKDIKELNDMVKEMVESLNKDNNF